MKRQFNPRKWDVGSRLVALGQIAALVSVLAGWILGAHLVTLPIALASVLLSLVGAINVASLPLTKRSISYMRGGKLYWWSRQRAL